MQQHAQSPKRRKLVLYFTYGVMTMAVALISAICIFLVLGYRFDFKNGDVEQGALLQFRSFPAGAAIDLDNSTLSFVTPGKKNVALGKHSVSMELDGYDVWEKTFSVKASELRWLNYARLIPKDLKTANVKEFVTVSGMLPSPDKKWMILSTAAEKPEFTLVDIRDEDKPAFASLNLPSNSYTQKEGQPHKFTLLEWDFGARYVLVRHDVGDVSEYLRVDRTDADNTVNISDELGLKLTDIHFSGTSGVVFYALENGAIRRLDSNSGTISQPIVRDVATFEVYKTETLSYVKLPINDRVGVGVVVNGKASRVATYDNSLPVLVDVNEYFNDYYFAIARGTQVELFKDPETRDREKLETSTSPTGLAWMQFSNSGRFVVAGNGAQFTTYDIETDETTSVNLPGTVVDATKPLQWLDDYYMVSTADNSLRITEFDGANQHVITTSLNGYPVTLNGNGKLMYSLNKTATGAVVLQSTKMTIE